MPRFSLLSRAYKICANHRAAASRNVCPPQALYGARTRFFRSKDRQPPCRQPPTQYPRPTPTITSLQLGLYHICVCVRQRRQASAARPRDGTATSCNRAATRQLQQRRTVHSRVHSTHHAGGAEQQQRVTAHLLLHAAALSSTCKQGGPCLTQQHLLDAALA